MKSQQIFNLFTYTGMLLIDNKILTTSPDYLREKTLRFFGTLGKPEFMHLPEPKWTILSDWPNTDFWTSYCIKWTVRNDDFELMNIINFLLNIFPVFVKSDKNLTFRKFERYIGDLNLISNENLSYMCHKKILNVVELNMNNRYLKLKILGN